MSTTTLNPDLATAPKAVVQPIPFVTPPRQASTESLTPETPTQSPRQSWTRKQWALTLLLAGVGIAVIYGGYHWFAVGRYVESTDDAYVGGDVTVIAPKVAGFIGQILVQDNQAVQAGDLLVKLDDRDYQAALARAEAAVAIQKASLVNLDALRSLQDAVVAQAQAGVAAAAAETTRTHDDQVRLHDLLQTGVASIQEFQKADADYKSAVAGGDKAQATLIAARRQLDVITTQKQQIQASLAAAQAEADLARLNLSYTELRAPVAGVVGNRSAQVGAYAPVGSQLISVVPAKGLWIDANFKEDQIRHIHPGATASVQVDLLGGKALTGHVVSLAPATGAQFSVLPTENATGNFTKIVQRVPVRIVLDDEAAVGGSLRPGLSVTARVNTK
ncbi:MAG TPA: HlyD family secretion protein [Verrucomicrobiae bacterium]